MTALLHLSDLHLAYEPEDPSKGSEGQYVGRVHAMSRAIQKLREDDPLFAEIDALALTGDILDTSVETEEHTRAVLRHLVTELRSTAGDVPVMMLPGNHDRRRVGLLSSRAPVLDAMRALSSPLGDGSRPGGTGGERLPNVFSAFADDPVRVLRLPGIDLPFVLTDSTYLDGGLIGAGGTVRSADILSVHAELANADKAPVFWLLHHHLVPTPMTDLERSGSGRFTEGFERWATQTGLRAARAIISNVDREELTMTAMGAGTVLSCLHTMRRPVLVLHGHKHYPTARLLKGIRYGENDVALLSAGSAGVTETPDARLLSIWPSFNAIRIDREGTGHSAHVTIVAFPPAGHPDARDIRIAPLVSLASHAERNVWEVREPPPRPHRSEWTRNEATYWLEDDGDVVNAVVTRRVEVVEGSPSAKERVFCDHLDGLGGASVSVGDDAVSLPTIQRFPLDGTRGEATYTIRKAVASNADAAERFYDESTPYEWIGLPNRYPCTELRLRVEYATDRLASAFASVTNLATGMETPVTLERDGDAVWAVVEACPPRHLLRVYWRLPKRARA